MKDKSNLDAVIAASGSHKILLENDKVRMLEVVIKPGEKEPMHIHELESVMIVVSPTKLRYYHSDGTSFEITPSADAKTEWMEPEPLHSVENIDDSLYKAIRVEIKPQVLLK